METDRTIWKYEIPEPDRDGRAWINLPRNSQLLSVALQGDKMVVWALVNPTFHIGLHRLIVCNTGTDVDIPPEAMFIGTITTPEGIVWHVWDGL